jgi:hypothetical protein
MEETKNQKPKEKLPEIISHHAMRKAIGILGISLPVFLLVGSSLFGDCDEVQQSISAYYHTNMRNIFVGIMCGVALFLYSYRGHDWMDNLAGYLGCIFALGVAFLPCPIRNPDPPCLDPLFQNNLVGNLHLVSAVLFFIILIIYSLYLFPKTHVDEKTRKKLEMEPQKKKRNIMFYICGGLMALSLVLILIYMWFLEDNSPGLKKIDPVFWLESTALLLFGISWLTKGQLILKDPDEDNAPDKKKRTP